MVEGGVVVPPPQAAVPAKRARARIRRMRTCLQ
jgi:hypothetical protein